MASVLAGSSAVFRHIHISRVDGSESERSFWGYFCEYSPPSPYSASASAFVHTQQYFSQLVTLKAASGQLAPRALSEVWDPPLCEARQSRVRAALGGFPQRVSSHPSPTRHKHSDPWPAIKSLLPVRESYSFTSMGGMVVVRPSFARVSPSRPH